MSKKSALEDLGFTSEKEESKKEKKTSAEGTEFKKEAVELVPQYHPCSYCGGQKRMIVKGSGEQVIVAFQLPLMKSVEGLTKKGETDRKPLLVCWECVFKVANGILGRAQFYRKEMENLTQGENEKNAGGFFPIVKP